MAFGCGTALVKGTKNVSSHLLDKPKGFLRTLICNEDCLVIVRCIGDYVHAMIPPQAEAREHSKRRKSIHLTAQTHDDYEMIDLQLQDDFAARVKTVRLHH